MDFFSRVMHEFSLLPCTVSWELTRLIFERAASLQPDHWLIPVRACESVGGSKQEATPATLAVGCAHVSILLVDDMLDDDPRGEYWQIGMPAAANLACFFQAAALQAVSRCAKDPASQAVAVTSFNEMFLQTAYGQYLDVQAPSSELGYWQVAKSKSAPFFGAALQIGALAGGAPTETSERLKELGCLYGQIIQIHDDMHDSMETPANPDWLQGRSPLPILFATLVEHPERVQFLELKERVDEPDALEEAQEILIRCGAISYCADQLIQKYEQAKEILSRIPLAHDESITCLFENVIAPVYKLLQAGEG